MIVISILVQGPEVREAYCPSRALRRLETAARRGPRVSAEASGFEDQVWVKGLEHCMSYERSSGGQVLLW